MLVFSLILDLVLIGLLLAGISYAVKLTRQLADVRAHRGEMERFVADFNATVSRAEAGVRNLRTASRASGDDLEKLIEKGQLLRDELLFLTESADQIAARLSERASSVSRGAAGETPEAPLAKKAPPSATERDLLRVLKKSG